MVEAIQLPERIPVILFVGEALRCLDRTWYCAMPTHMPATNQEIIKAIPKVARELTAIITQPIRPPTTFANAHQPQIEIKSFGEAVILSITGLCSIIEF
jgi:hypothetical protein